jgi:3-methyladenine DNA glycosylase AlkD
MEKSIREKLLNLADEKYQKFTAALLPDVDNILGVRLPLLRKLAREIAKGDWRGYMTAAGHEYYEEIMLRGMVLGYVKADADEILRYVVGFVPKIDNWSVCDSFCSGLKFTKNHKAHVWDFLQPYFTSKGEYELRFGIVMLLNYYMDKEYINRVLLILDSVKRDGYYVRMAVAWAVSICYIKLPDRTMEYLKNNMLDDFTYNKALQKITESYRVDTAAKDFIRSLKRK